MGQRFTIETIKKSKVAHLNQHVIASRKTIKDAGGRKVAKHFKKKSAALDYIGWNLLYWANERAVTLEEEHLFDNSNQRKYRFDWAIPSLKIAVEYEGGIFMEKAGHNTATGVTRDSDKYNLAQSQGWTVLRFTTLNYKSLITELNKTICR